MDQVLLRELFHNKKPYGQGYPVLQSFDFMMDYDYPGNVRSSTTLGPLFLLPLRRPSPDNWHSSLLYQEPDAKVRPGPQPGPPQGAGCHSCLPRTGRGSQKCGQRPAWELLTAPAGAERIIRRRTYPHQPHQGLRDNGAGAYVPAINV